MYAYDKAGNRTSEQVDLGVSAGTDNNLNQLISLANSVGPVRYGGLVTGPLDPSNPRQVDLSQPSGKWHIFGPRQFK